MTGQVWNTQRLVYTKILVEYPRHHCENREAPGKKRNLWNEKDYVTGISHEQKVTNNKITVRYNNFSEVLHAEQSFAGS